MWEDMVLYWAWRGDEPASYPPPTRKRIVYTDLGFNDMHMASHVYDDPMGGTPDTIGRVLKGAMLTYWR